MKIHISKITNIILGTGIFFVCALLAKEIVLKYKPLTLETGTGSQAPVSKPSGDKDFSQYRVIADSGLFGQGELTLIDNSSADSVDTASADIILVGTVVGMHGVNYAIFYEKQSGKQDIFSKGEKVFNIGGLAAVEENRAILSSNGKELVFYILPADKCHSAPIAPEEAAAMPVAPGIK